MDFFFSNLGEKANVGGGIGVGQSKKTVKKWGRKRMR